jgi:hypothetical protein
MVRAMMPGANRPMTADEMGGVAAGARGVAGTLVAGKHWFFVLFQILIRVIRESSNPGNNLHVSGLAHKVDNRDLELAFGKYGRVCTVSFR